MFPIAKSILINKNDGGDGECLIGISMFAGENHGHHRDPVGVTFLVSTLNGHANVPAMIQDAEPVQVKSNGADAHAVCHTLADANGLYRADGKPSLSIGYCRNG